MIDLILAALLLQAAPEVCNAAGQPETPRAGCPRWRLTQQEEDVTDYTDPASVNATGDGFLIDQRTVFAEDRPSGLRSIITTMRVDCVRRTLIADHVKGYDSAGGLLSDGPIPNARLHPIEPNSSAARMVAEFCPR